MLPRQTYHFFNRANGWENLFLRTRDYNNFIGKMKKHVASALQFQAFSMIPKHFHLCGRVRDEDILQLVLNVAAQQLRSNKSVSALIERSISRKFSNGFNGYAQWFNKSNTRKGSLFVPNFKKEVVEGEEELKKVIHFIHANPVVHKLVDRIEDWPFSSYPVILGAGKTFLDREFILGLFGGSKAFVEYHKQPWDKTLNTLE